MKRMKNDGHNMQYRKGRASPWVVQYRERGSIKTQSFEKKEDATEFEAKIRRNRQLAKAGLQMPQENLLFIDFCRKYMKKREKLVTQEKTLSLSSYLQDESRLRNYWLEPLGTFHLQQITSPLVKKYLDNIQFELHHTPADRNRHRSLLHSIFQDALVDGLILYNPIKAIPLVKERAKRVKFIPTNIEIVEKYIEYLYAEGNHYGLMGDGMMWTGARVTMVSALQWRDVNFDANTIIFRRIEQRAGGSKIVERTKGTGTIENDSECLTIPLFPKYREILLRHFKNTDFTRKSDFIATDQKGNYIRYDTFKDVHKRAILKSGLPTNLTPHSIRGAFATYAKKKGYAISDIGELLGHSSEHVTRRYFQKDITHLIDKGNRIGFGNVNKKGNKK